LRISASGQPEELEGGADRWDTARAMSQENVEIVRRVYAAWEKGDFSTAEAFDPYVRVVWVDPMLAERAETMGLRDTRRNMREFLDAYERMTATAERIIDAGDRVAVVSSWRGRGKASGVEFAERQGSVWTISDGKVTRIVNYRDPAEALEAAGLSE
jgi:ketosteroid isomerase-like protein